eukprot:gene2070-2347_t
MFLSGGDLMQSGTTPIDGCKLTFYFKQDASFTKSEEDILKMELQPTDQMNELAASAGKEISRRESVKSIVFQWIAATKNDDTFFAELGASILIEFENTEESEIGLQRKFCCTRYRKPFLHNSPVNLELNLE